MPITLSPFSGYSIFPDYNTPSSRNELITCSLMYPNLSVTMILASGLYYVASAQLVFESDVLKAGEWASEKI